jgi:hypothetical protein
MLIKILPYIRVLALIRLQKRLTRLRNPTRQAINLIHSDQKRRFPRLQNIHTLKSLHLKTPQNINYQNSDVGYSATPLPQVNESLMPRRIDNKQPWNVYPALQLLQQWARELSQSLSGKETGANMLRYAADFPSLNTTLPNLVQQTSLSRVNVTENTHDGLPNRHDEAPLEQTPRLNAHYFFFEPEGCASNV